MMIVRRGHREIIAGLLLGLTTIGPAQAEDDRPPTQSAPVSTAETETAPEVDLEKLQVSLQPLIDEIQRLTEAGEALAAGRKQRELVEALITALGADHDFVWQAENELEFRVSEVLITAVEQQDYVTARQAVRLLKHLQPDPDFPEPQAARWSELFLVRWCLNQDRLTAASELLQQDEASFAALPETNLQRLESVLLKGQLAERRGDYPTADQLYRDVERLTQATAAPVDSAPDRMALYVEALAGRVQVGTMQGDWDQATQLCQTWRAAAVSQGQAGQSSVAESWLAETAILRYSGRLAEAEVACRKALVQLEVLAAADAPPQLLTALAWNELSLIQALLGEPLTAHQSALRAWQIYTALLGPDAPVVTRLEGNLAELARQLPLEERQQFEGFLDQALERARATPSTPPRVLATLLQTAARYAELDHDWATAAEYFQTVVELRQQALGDQHHATARAHFHLARCQMALGQLDDAQGSLSAALKTFEIQFGPRHVETAMVIADQGLLAELHREFSAAASYYRQALERLQQARARIGVRGLDAVGLSESAMVTARLVTLLANQQQAADAAFIWQRSLGASLREEVALRQLRTLQPAASAELRQLEDELAQVTAQLDRLRTSDVVEPTTIVQLRQQEDRLLAELVELKQRFLQSSQEMPGIDLDLATLQQSLNHDEAIIGWVSRSDAIPTTVPQHWGVVLRPPGKPVWIPLAEGEFADLATRLRDAIARTDFTPLVELQPLIAQMRNIVWKPLAAALAETADGPAVRTLLVMPSPGLQGVPINLFAEFQQRVVYLPSGAISVWLQQRTQARSSTAAQGLLAIGDPEFLPADQSGTLQTAARWSPLPGTRQEVQAIAAACERQHEPITLRFGADAQQTWLADQAKENVLQQYRWLHFATHGEANPHLPLRSRLILAHEPLLTDGVAGAGPSYEAPSELTAETILRTWNLQADLVTLSACESALGRFTASEGYVGFSQALLLAGSQSVVSSLWKVDDLATALLMTRFYENLLGARDDLPQPLPVSESLHEAQQWLRMLTDVEQQRMLSVLQQGRPLQTVAATAPPNGNRISPYAHPHYWAAFVLIGNPR
ncbi:CHAT domain-containing protein [bacterium]|nr:CHAT domain-containing protein [bacterium]